MRLMLVLCALIGLPFAWQPARAAADYPARPIRIIDGFAPGSANDFVARVVGEHLTPRLGQSVVVENRPGATGNIGAAIAAKATPDGHTLFIGLSSSMAASASLFPDLGYNLLKDFDYVTLAGYGTYVLVVGPNVPAKSLQALVALAKSRPGELRYGSAGVGSPLHLGMEMMNRMAGVRMSHVPYKSSALMAPAMVNDEVQVGFSSLASAQALIKAGRLTPLAVTGTRRAKAFPQLPTVAESGFPGFDVTPWYGFLAPAGTPRAAVGKLNKVMNDVLQLPEVEAKFETQGIEPAGSTPEQFKKVMTSEVQLWNKVIREAGIKAK